jgi:hypothetical protein
LSPRPVQTYPRCYSSSKTSSAQESSSCFKMTVTLSRFTQNPLFLLALSYIFPALIAFYTPPKAIVLRLGAVGLVTFYTLYIFQHVDTTQIPSSTIYIYACAQIGVLLYSSYFLCLEPISPPSTAQSFLQKAVWIFKCVASNPRGIGTPWELKHLSPFSRSNPSYIPSRTSFLISRTSTCIFFMILSAAFQRIDETYYWPLLHSGEYAPEREHILRRLPNVDIREILIRLYLPLQYHLPAYSTISWAHAVLSIIGVVLGDEPASWPPLFGSLTDAYSLRRFYSHFWQRFHRIAFVAHASFFTHDLLRVLRGSRLSRSLVTLSVFVMSAGMHALCIKLEGGKCEIGPVMHWFCLASGGIVLEDWVMSAWERWMWKGRGKASMNIWRYVLGYMWVWGFFAWSLPKMIFPNVDCKLVD